MAAKKKVKRAKKGKKAAKPKPVARKKAAKKKVAKKAKAKVVKEVKKKVRAKKKVAKEVPKKKVTRRTKAPAKKTVVKTTLARAPVEPVAPTPPQPSLFEERVGVVTHYYTDLSVAVVQLDAGVLRVGDTVHIKGHTTDFTQKVQSMEIEHVPVSEARPPQSFGLKVREHAREHDVVYRVRTP